MDPGAWAGFAGAVGLEDVYFETCWASYQHLYLRGLPTTRIDRSLAPRWGGCERRLSKENSGFDIHRLSIDDVRLEPPLHQGIRDRLGLIRKSAQKMNVLDLAGLIDDDADGNGIEAAL